MSRSRPVLSLLLALLAGLLVSAGLTACGGQTITADEVTAPPPELAIPDDEVPAADPLDADADADEDRDTTTGDTGDSAGGDGGSAAAGGGPGATGATGGTAAPAPQATPVPTQAAQPDTAENDSPPPAGSGAEKFEEFCEQNPGAC